MAKQGENGIAWTDVTWNPIRGCSRVSEGCRNCYAERVAARFSGTGQPYEGLAKIHNIKRADGSTLRTEPRWTGLVRFVEERLEDPIRWRKPSRVFVNSMSDLFHEHVPDKWIALIFGVMAASPQHTFQILTKRAERMLEWAEGIDSITPRDCTPRLLNWPSQSGEPRTSQWPLPNVWMGVSVEDQNAADERIPLLLATTAAVRWVSYEPALGPVTFMSINGQENNLDWIVCGDESGPRARTAQASWYRNARRDCEQIGAAFFMKQRCIDGKKIPFEVFPADLQVREYPK
jgi:protein gp37